MSQSAVLHKMKSDSKRHFVLRVLAFGEIFRFLTFSPQKGPRSGLTGVWTMNSFLNQNLESHGGQTPLMAATGIDVFGHIGVIF